MTVPCVLSEKLGLALSALVCTLALHFCRVLHVIVEFSQVAATLPGMLALTIEAELGRHC